MKRQFQSLFVKTLLLLITIFLSTSLLAPLHSQPFKKTKISSTLQVLVDEYQKLKDSLSEANVIAASAGETDSISASTINRKYDCIVYTRNYEAISNKGIIAQRVFPTFVTLSITIDQVLQLAAMPEILYIEYINTNRHVQNKKI